MVEYKTDSEEKKHYFELMRHFFEEEIKFNRHVGMTIDTLGEGWARVKVTYSPALIGDPWRPAIHGGVISTVIDTVGGLAAFTVVNPGDKLSTVDLRVVYLRPGRLADLYGEARVLRIGNRVAVCDMFVWQDEPDKHIATGKGVYNVKRSDD